MDNREIDQVQQLIARSRRNTENVVMAAPIGICITDPDGRFEMVNPAYCDFYGYAEQELLGECFTLVVPDALKPAMQALHRDFIEGEDTHELRQEWQVCCKNGESRTIIAEAARIEGDDGRPRKMTFVIDITERKQLEERLNDLNERLDHLAHHDELTGIFNRRAGLARLKEERERSERYETPLSIAIYDLDHFKHINDTYGHAVGDDVLREVTALVQTVIRETDLLVRLGGEGFLVIMPGVESVGAHQAMERVRETLAKAPLTQRQLTMTLSAGTIEYQGEHPDRLLELADDALYRAKAAGRNQVDMSE